MQPITRQQIAELPDKEKQQLWAVTNHFLGQQYAAQQRRKRIMKARLELESEADYETMADS